MINKPPLDKPHFFGRTGRFLVGVFALYYVAHLVSQFSVLSAPKVFFFDIGNVAGIVFVGMFINDVINIGLARSTYDNKPFKYLVLSVSLLAVISFLQNGTVFSAYFTIYVYALLLYFYIHLGIAHILASVFATPGCEMNVTGSIISKHTQKPWQNHTCSGLWSPVDTWENNRMEVKNVKQN
jgi:hypothetical protein